MEGFNPAWLALGAVVVIVFVVVLYRWRAASRSGADDPRYRADRSHPLKRWAHGALAAYRGLDAGDPGYWSVDDATEELANWSTPDRAALVELLTRYEGEEINVAFDKVRIVWLARVGAGARRLGEQESWDYIERAAVFSRRRYGTWDAFADDVVAGSIEWNRDVAESPLDGDAIQRRRDRIADCKRRVWPETPFN